MARPLWAFLIQKVGSKKLISSKFPGEAAAAAAGPGGPSLRTTGLQNSERKKKRKPPCSVKGENHCHFFTTIRMGTEGLKEGATPSAPRGPELWVDLTLELWNVGRGAQPKVGVARGAAGWSGS